MNRVSNTQQTVLLLASTVSVPLSGTVPGIFNIFEIYLGLEMDVHMSLFVSPIVFPLAFSINGRFYIQDNFNNTGLLYHLRTSQYVIIFY